MVRLALRKRREAGEIKLSDGLVDEAQARLFEWRSRDLQKKPSLAELLAWLSVLEVQGVKTLPSEVEKMPGISAIFKTADDRRIMGIDPASGG